MHIGVLYCIVSSMFLPRSNRNVSPATCYACATDRYGLLLLPGPRWSGWRAWEISAMHDCREPVSIPANSNAWHVMSSDTWTPSSTVMQKLSSRIVAGISDLDMHQKIVEERNLGEFETGEVLDGFGNRDIDVTLNALNNSCYTAQDQSVSVYRLMSNKLAQVLAFSAHIFGVCCPQRYLEFLEKKCNPCARLKPIEHWFGRVWSLEGRATGTEVLACCAASEKTNLCPTFCVQLLRNPELWSFGRMALGLPTFRSHGRFTAVQTSARSCGLAAEAFSLFKWIKISGAKTLSARDVRTMRGWQ